MLAELPEETQWAIRDDAIQTLGVMFPDGPVTMGGEVILATGFDPG